LHGKRNGTARPGVCGGDIHRIGVELGRLVLRVQTDKASGFVTEKNRNCTVAKKKEQELQTLEPCPEQVLQKYLLQDPDASLRFI